MGEVDPSFIQAIEHRPKLTITEAEGIPLIDLSISDTQLVVSQVAEACKNWGFFQVINHGVPLQLQEKVFLASKSFFAQSKEEKQRVRRDELNPLGYYDTEHTKNVRDWKEVFDFTVENPILMPASPDPQDKDVKKFTNQWPRNPEFLRELCEEYAQEVENLSFKIMGLIALSLGLAANRFDEFFKDSTSFIRLNYYPPCPIPDLALGVGRHKDAGALTVLSQDDVGGLEVKRKTDGEWIRVKPTPNAYIINVGDIIQVWSNDKYESVEHRVMVNSERERFSVPFFFNPSHSTTVKPLVQLTNDENPAYYKEYNWGKFFATRKLSNFKKLAVENIQIHHFKVINHGVPLKLREKLELASKSFFAQPKEEKLKVRRDEANPFGYYDTEHTKNVRDWKEVFDFTVENPTILPASPDPDDKELIMLVNQWPENPKYMREAFEEYAQEVEKLCYKLMQLIALSLGLPANRFDKFFANSTSRIRLNHYPPCPVPHLALGVGRHKDGGALTVLYQDEVGGLEVKRKTDGEWIRVKPTSNAYIINVGDIVQVWSNDKYESVEHRAMVNSEKERFSIPFFFNPEHSTMVEPLIDSTDDENPPKYRAYNWGKFNMNRRRSNFKKLAVENIQIYHFKVSS